MVRYNSAFYLGVSLLQLNRLRDTIIKISVNMENNSSINNNLLSYKLKNYFELNIKLYFKDCNKISVITKNDMKSE
jgi:hypothetical protein